MSKVAQSHLALFIVNLIYGVNYVVAKDIMPAYLLPNALIFYRAIGAMLLFWCIYAFYPEKIERKDLGRLALCGLFGVATNQLLFFNGLNLTSPLNASIIMIATPIIVFVMSFFILGESLKMKKIIGIVTGSTGAVWLLLMKNQGGTLHSQWGDLFVFLNATSFALYLVLVKPLMLKYRPFTVTTWVFTFGSIYVLSFPSVWTELNQAHYAEFSTTTWMELLYIIVAVTFLTYLLNNFALKHVSPAVNSSYIYFQPFFAAVLSLLFSFWGFADYSDSFTWDKLFSALLIATGVYLISKKEKVTP